MARKKLSDKAKKRQVCFYWTGHRLDAAKRLAAKNGYTGKDAVRDWVDDWFKSMTAGEMK